MVVEERQRKGEGGWGRLGEAEAYKNTTPQIKSASAEDPVQKQMRTRTPHRFEDEMRKVT